MNETPAISVGHALDLAAAESGVVHSVFSHAINLLIRGDMWTLLAEGKPDLPFGIQVALPGFDTLGLQRGDSVHVRARRLSVGNGRLVVDCRAAARWLPDHADTLEPGLAGRLAIVAAAVRGRSWDDSAKLAGAVRRALEHPEALQTTLAEVVGRGPGATPSGDDVLVGIFAVLTSRSASRSGAEKAQLLGRTLRPFFRTTTDISAHLLAQAANGLFGRRLLELVSALLGDVSLADVRKAVLRVMETGATSGADTCMGLLEFAPSYFVSSPVKAAA